MKILHLCSAYILNNLYKELFEAIDSLGIEQDIYIPIKTNIRVAPMCLRYWTLYVS